MGLEGRTVALRPHSSAETCHASDTGLADVAMQDLTRASAQARSVAYTTKAPKTLRWMTYEPGGPQAWNVVDLGSESAYPTITGAIFEFGFSDAILQMWAAFLDELAHGREGMRQPFHCATPEEAAATHRIFTAALEAQATGSVVTVGAVLA